MQSLDVGRLRKILHSLDVLGEGPDPCPVHHVTQELETLDRENAFRRVNYQPILVQHGKELPQVFHVLVEGPTGDKMIVQVGEHKRQTPKQSIHETLERLCCVRQTERHKQIFKHAERCHNCRFLHIIRRHRDLVVTLHQIHAGKIPTPVKL